MTKRAAGRVPTRFPAGRAAAFLIALHVALLVWIACTNSVSFDENFHLPAGVAAITRQDFSVSYAQPPLARVAWGAAALLAGARAFDGAEPVAGDERSLSARFQRANHAAYGRIFLAGRLVTVLMAAVLAWMIWRTAREWYGDAGGLLALAAWSFAPEALAHGSLVSMDVPTALVFTGGMLAGARWLLSARWRDWLVLAAWVAAAFLVRFSAAQLLAALGVLAVILAALRRLARPGVALAGLALLPLVAWLAVDAGYLFQGVGRPLGSIELHSAAFTRLLSGIRQWPSPLPEPYVRGLDYLAFLARPGEKASYFLGQVRHAPDWRYFPVAIAVKWPLGLLALVLLRTVHLVRSRARDAVRELTLLVPAGVVLGWCMASNLDYGVRYVLPVLPFVCVWIGGLAHAAAPGAANAARSWVLAGSLWVLIEAAECARALPYPLAFFNAFAGGPGRGDRIVNDSNVDWGQGLLALRADMARLGIHRIYLAYHGTADPALYGIDYVAYHGGAPGTESDWIAVSSYFLVGLPARMVTTEGDSDFLSFNMGPLLQTDPVTRPAGCMYLFRIR